mmetsp:Transcript_46343/g.134244  ORF Transcript_46343/g.134244 Transcript_46343/m.134244 type:complete len:228 (-) Transcript_46343:954-1637(-)
MSSLPASLTFQVRKSGPCSLDGPLLCVKFGSLCRGNGFAHKLNVAALGGHTDFELCKPPLGRFKFTGVHSRLGGGLNGLGQCCDVGAFTSSSELSGGQLPVGIDVQLLQLLRRQLHILRGDTSLLGRHDGFEERIPVGLSSCRLQLQQNKPHPRSLQGLCVGHPPIGGSFKRLLQGRDALGACRKKQVQEQEPLPGECQRSLPDTKFHSCFQGSAELIHIVTGCCSI